MQRVQVYDSIITTRHQPLKVILVAYYRSGSTLAAQPFNENPTAMYWYEPLAAVTSEWGWEADIIPQRNLYHYDNGTEK